MKNIKIKYIFIHGFYWMAICTVTGYLNVFLTGRSLNPYQIGIISALANILATILQPVISSLGSSKNKFSLKSLLLVTSALSLLFSILVVFIKKPLVPMAIMFIILVALINCIHPLINSFGLLFSNNGYDIDYSLSRGIGSLTFATASVILGRLTLVNPESSNYFTIVCVILLIFAIAITPMPESKGEHKFETKDENIEIEKNPTTDRSLFWFFIAIIFTFTNHNMLTTFMYQIVENIGGTSKTMGVVFAIAAMVEVPAMMSFSKILKRFSVEKITIFSFFMFFIKAVLILISKNTIMLYLVQITQSVSFGLCIPACVNFVNKVSPPEKNAKNQGIFTAAMTTGTIIASIVGGYLVDYYPVRLTIAVAAISSLIGFFIARREIHKFAR